MVYRVVSTKLTEEEHTALLDLCGQHGISPSAFTRSVIIERLKSDNSEPSHTVEKKEDVKQESKVKAEEKKESNDLSGLALLIKRLAASSQTSEPRKTSPCSLNMHLSH